MILRKAEMEANKVRCVLESSKCAIMYTSCMCMSLHMNICVCECACIRAYGTCIIVHMFGACAIGACNAQWSFLSHEAY